LTRPVPCPSPQNTHPPPVFALLPWRPFVAGGSSNHHRSETFLTPFSQCSTGGVTETGPPFWGYRRSLRPPCPCVPVRCLASVGVLGATKGSRVICSSTVLTSLFPWPLTWPSCPLLLPPIPTSAFALPSTPSRFCPLALRAENPQKTGVTFCRNLKFDGNPTSTSTKDLLPPPPQTL